MNDKRTVMCAHVCCAPRTRWTTAQKSADCNVPYCEIFKCSVVRLLQFYKKKGEAKNTAVLKKLCIENGISLVKLG